MTGLNTAEPKAVVVTGNGAPSGTPDPKPAPTASLDDLLREFEPKPVAHAEPKPTTQADPTSEVKPTAPVISHDEVTAVKNLLAAENQRNVDAGLNKAVTLIQESADALVNVPSRFIEGELYKRAATDKRFLEAFMLRDTRPDAWQKILQAVAKDLESDVTTTQSNKLASDRARVHASVRGIATTPASQSAVSNEDISKLSSGRFNRFKALLNAGKSQQEAYNAVTSAPQR